MLLSVQTCPLLVVALTGELGSGKTTLVQGIAEGLGIMESVNSPTFTLINEYHAGNKPLYHVDLYRLAQAPTPAAVPVYADQDAHMLRSELNEIFHLKGVVAIEWAELLQNYLPPDCLQICLSYVKDGTARCAKIEGLTAVGIKEEMEKEQS
jgi:tRNA threonylcarbamoyladenosine biosynthesis protein TsaE